MKEKIIFIGTGEAAKELALTGGQLQRAIVEKILEPDGYLQTRTHMVALWNPKRLHRLKALMQPPNASGN